jgi:hypothetical protein
MSEERMVKKVYKWKPMLTKPLGRPKIRWEDGIRNDMKVKQPRYRPGVAQRVPGS